MAIFAARWSDGNTYQLHFLESYGRHSLKIKNYSPVIKAQIIKYRLVNPLQKAKIELTWAQVSPSQWGISGTFEMSAPWVSSQTALDVFLGNPWVTESQDDVLLPPGMDICSQATVYRDPVFCLLQQYDGNLLVLKEKPTVEMILGSFSTLASFYLCVLGLTKEKFTALTVLCFAVIARRVLITDQW